MMRHGKKHELRQLNLATLHDASDFATTRNALLLQAK